MQLRKTLLVNKNMLIPRKKRLIISLLNGLLLLWHVRHPNLMNTFKLFHWHKNKENLNPKKLSHPPMICLVFLDKGQQGQDVKKPFLMVPGDQKEEGVHAILDFAAVPQRSIAVR